VPAAIIIRPIERDERAAWEPLWRAYLTFYETTLSDTIVETTWVRLNDPTEPMFALGAYRDGKLTGITHYLFHRSAWSISDSCYLQDLYVAETARGSGIGRALIEAVADKAREAGSSRLYWHTHETNRTAQALYDKVATLSGFVQYRKDL
jgi:GNAT superfamily N-acetyltransferase